MTIFVGRNESWVVPVGWATTRISCILTSCGNLKDSACANTKVHLKFRHNTQMSSFSPTLKLKIMFWYVLMQWIEGESRGNHGFYNIWVPPGFSLQSILGLMGPNHWFFSHASLPGTFGFPPPIVSFCNFWSLHLYSHLQIRSSSCFSSNKLLVSSLLSD